MSGVSEDEYAQIVGSWLALTDKEFNCQSCLAKYAKRPNASRDTAYWREMKGCEGPIKITKTGIMEKHHVQFMRCPGNFRTPQGVGWIMLWRSFDKTGALPYPGGVAEQPAKIMEIFSIIDSLRAETEAEAERAREHGRKQRTNTR